MKVKIIDYKHRSQLVDIPDGTKAIRVEVVTGDEVFIYADENGIIQIIDSSDVFGTLRHEDAQDGIYNVMVGTPEWEEWINQPDDSYYWLYKDYGDS